MRKINSKNIVVFFDFDNTITTHDVLDDIILRFSKDERWKELEKRWKDGEIGSRKCLDGQVGGVRITKRTLDAYLSKVKIDPYFKKLKALLDSKKIRTCIVSDNFDYILNRILAANGFENLRLYSNHLEFDGDRLIPEFPLTNKRCGSCAHCKKTSLMINTSEGSTAIYIGDGLSDVCASKCAAYVFAKASLLDYYRKKGLDHIPHKNLKDVYSHMTRSMI